MEKRAGSHPSKGSYFSPAALEQGHKTLMWLEGVGSPPSRDSRCFSCDRVQEGPKV